MRCTGHCCRVFTLPYFPDEMRRRYKFIRDGEQIYRMIIYIGFERTEIGIHARYTCRYYNDDDKICMIYKDRPEMCQNYPYSGMPCTYPGCTLSGKEIHIHNVLQSVRTGNI